jgi:hypothetical protein
VEKPPVAESFEPTEAESEDEGLFDGAFVLVGIAVGALAFVGVIADCSPRTGRPYLLVPRANLPKCCILTACG